MSKSTWGHGAAKLTSPATREATELVVFLSDLHVPYQDEAVTKSALKLIKSIKPHRVVLNGDISDFFQISRFNAAGERLESLQDEVDEANAFRAAVRKTVPDAVIDEVDGNHDNRLGKYIAVNARALSTLRALEPSKLFLYDDLNINWHSGAGFLLRQEFLVKHGTMVRKDSGYTAKAELLQAGVSGISGHTHRMATFRKGGYTTRQWTEGGCLCRLDPDYIVGQPDWTQGLVVGEFSTTTSSFMTTEVPFVDGKLRLGLKSF